MPTVIDPALRGDLIRYLRATSAAAARIIGAVPRSLLMSPIESMGSLRQALRQSKLSLSPLGGTRCGGESTDPRRPETMEF